MKIIAATIATLTLSGAVFAAGIAPTHAQNVNNPIPGVDVVVKKPKPAKTNTNTTSATGGPAKTAGTPIGGTDVGLDGVGPGRDGKQKAVINTSRSNIKKPSN